MPENIMYCTFCKEDVSAKSGFNVFVFLLLFCLVVGPGLLYACIHLIGPKNKCSNCGATCITRDFDDIS